MRRAALPAVSAGALPLPAGAGSGENSQPPRLGCVKRCADVPPAIAAAMSPAHARAAAVYGLWVERRRRGEPLAPNLHRDALVICPERPRVPAVEIVSVESPRLSNLARTLGRSIETEFAPAQDASSSGEPVVQGLFVFVPGTAPRSRPEGVASTNPSFGGVAFPETKEREKRAEAGLPRAGRPHI